MKSHILLIEAAYDKGLIHNLSGILFMHDLVIQENKEFLDKYSNLFFKRTEFSGDVDDVKLLFDLYLALGEKAKIQLVEKRKKDIVVFCSHEHHCIGDLLIRNECGDFNAVIKAVISNHDTLRTLVERFNIPFYTISDKNCTRENHEAAILDVMNNYNPEYIVLAKYMRILTPDFVTRYPNRIINIHHSFLPAFIGANPYRQAFDRGVKIIGATAHFVNNELDQGPIITQEVKHIDHSKGPKELAHEGKELERALLAKALELSFEDRIFVTGNKTIIFE